VLGVALAAAAGLAGCAYQDPLSLPPLGSAGSGGAPSTSPQFGYGYGGGYYDPRFYGYDPLRRYYDPRLGYYYSGGYPGYYGPVPYPHAGYNPYPGYPYCVDANRDGRCDRPRDGGGNGSGHGGGGKGPGLDPKRDPFEQVKEVTRRAERAESTQPAPAAMAPNPPRQQRPVEPKRSVEPRRVNEPKRAPGADVTRATPETE
jgi:hypothetical protein